MKKNVLFLLLCLPLLVSAQTSTSPNLEMVWGKTHYKFNEKHEITSAELRNLLLGQSILVYDGTDKLILHQTNLLLIPLMSNPLEFLIQPNGLIELKSGADIATIDFAEIASNAILDVEFILVEYPDGKKQALPPLVISIKD